MTHLKLSFKINLTVQNITNYTYSMKRIFYMILMVSIQTKKSIMKKVLFVGMFLVLIISNTSCAQIQGENKNDQASKVDKMAKNNLLHPFR